MALVKCPLCEINYMQDTDKYCKVCLREMKGIEDPHATEHVEMCIVCGERPARPGNELCSVCLSEHKSLSAESEDPYVDDLVDPAEEALHEVDDLDGLELELDSSDDDESPDDELPDMDEEYTDEEEEQNE